MGSSNVGYTRRMGSSNVGYAYRMGSSNVGYAYRMGSSNVGCTYRMGELTVKDLADDLRELSHQQPLQPSSPPTSQVSVCG